MEFELTIKFDLSERLERIMETLLYAARLPKEEAAARLPEPAAPEQNGLPREAMAAEPRVEAAPLPEEKTAPKAEEKAGIVTDDELRTAMDMAISRLAGYGWKENMTEDVKNIRRQCTAIFRQLAADLGAVKPTAIDQSNRGLFISMLDGIAMDANTGKVEYCPF